MREACKFNAQIHNGNILKTSVTKDPGVSSILLFSGSGINFPRPLYVFIPKILEQNQNFLICSKFFLTTAKRFYLFQKLRNKTKTF
jgi:hypothetical protein